MAIEVVAISPAAFFLDPGSTSMFEHSIVGNLTGLYEISAHIGVSGHLRPDVPGEQFGDAVDGVVGDASEQLADMPPDRRRSRSTTLSSSEFSREPMETDIECPPDVVRIMGIPLRKFNGAQIGGITGWIVTIGTIQYD